MTHYSLFWFRVFSDNISNWFKYSDATFGLTDILTILNYVDNKNFLQKTLKKAYFYSQLYTYKFACLFSFTLFHYFLDIAHMSNWQHCSCVGWCHSVLLLIRWNSPCMLFFFWNNRKYYSFKIVCENRRKYASILIVTRFQWDLMTKI